VHLHHVTSLFLCALPARLAGIRHVLMTEHSLHQLLAEPATRAMTRRYAHLATAISTVAPAQLDYFREQLGVSADKLVCIPNGIEVPERTAAATSAARAALGIDPQRLLICYAGRLVPIKQLDLLLRAVALLPLALRERSTVCLIGDGESRADLERLATTLGLGGTVRFAGARTQVASLLLGADAFVMSSESEGLPMAMLEAMAAAVPCVSTAVGGIPELLRDEAGLLVRPGDAEGLAAALASLLADPALRARIGARGLARIREEYSFERMVSAYLARLGLPATFPPPAP
jgi:glycosyltransferase involved in cell wall biosynthesis